MAVETVACSVIGINAGEVDYLALARIIGIGVGELGQITVKGVSIEEVQCRFVKALDTGQASQYMFPEVETADGDACSGCAATLYLSLKNVKAKGLLEKMRGMTLAIGEKTKEFIC